MSATSQLHPQFVTDSSGSRTGVILPFDEYEELLEDLGDLAIAAERRDEPTVAHEELLADLRSNGYLPD